MTRSLATVHRYDVRRRELVEPDWTRFPGWRDVTREEWESAKWQRVNSVRNVRQLRAVLGDLVDDRFYADLLADQRQYATMSMLVPPQMVNTMMPATVPDTDGLYADPVRRYMIPVASDRLRHWPSHPRSRRDPLRERGMWVTDGMTHRYPTKVLAELLSSCPQYCGHCTRMDLVGASTPTVSRTRFSLKPGDRHDAMIEYVRAHPEVRDVVVSGGDVANLPWHRLEWFVMRLLEIESVRDIRLASKSLAAIPQHWLQREVIAGLGRIARRARVRGVNLAVHSHVNHVGSLTPLVARAARAVLDTGIRDVRNQGVLLRGVNGTAADLLDLCLTLQGETGILPYYFYLCDMIPGAEYWRLAVWQAQRLQHQIMGYLPGYATPRLVCDVPMLGKQWVHMTSGYDREHGISYWTKSYRTPLDHREDRVQICSYYDPIDTLPPSGRQWWATTAGDQSALAGESTPNLGGLSCPQN